MLEFYILGEPVGAARSRFGRPPRGGTRTGWYLPDKTGAMVKSVRAFACVAIGKRTGYPLTGPVICGFRFELSNLDLNFPDCGQKPDLDNLEKTVLDGLSGIVFQDDAQVVGWLPFPYHSKFPVHPRDAKTYIRVLTLEEYHQNVDTLFAGVARTVEA